MQDNLISFSHKSNEQHTQYNIHRATVVSWIPPIILFCVGIVVFIPYTLTDILWQRIVQVIVFFLFANQIKHIRVWYFIMITISVTFFHLLVPNGRVIYEIGVFRVTEGAIKEGLFRGLTLNGYVFLSLWCISQRLALPTKYGRMLSLSVQYFYLIVSIYASDKYKTFITAQGQETKRMLNKIFSGSRASIIVKKVDILILYVISKITHQEMEIRIQDTSKIHVPKTDKISDQCSADILDNQKSSTLQKIVGLCFVVLAIVVAWMGVFV